MAYRPSIFNVKIIGLVKLFLLLFGPRFISFSLSLSQSCNVIIRTKGKRNVLSKIGDPVQK